ncbi:MAG: helix-turn-helix domain-containing protein [Burkholderiaceae bacterium]|nr:helix-turn-helix domain-containing protein [Burkholderiaceae bacterium]
MSPDGENKLVSALVRGTSILQCFTPTVQELSGRELTEITGLPKPTLFRLLDTLCELGLLRYSERVSKYVPGLGLLNLAAPVLARMTIRQLARPLMEDLAQQIDGQLQLTVGSGWNLSCVEVVQGSHSKVFRPEVGVHVSLSRTASGRAYLSMLPAAQRAQYLAELEAQEPPRSAWLQERLADAQQDLERHGFCRSHGDLHREIASIAVPMQKPRDDESWIFAASVPVFSPHSKALESDVGPRLIALVRSVEAALGTAG